MKGAPFHPQLVNRVTPAGCRLTTDYPCVAEVVHEKQCILYTPGIEIIQNNKLHPDLLNFQHPQISMDTWTNFLRIAHEKQYKFTYWRSGGEISFFKQTLEDPTLNQQERVKKLTQTLSDKRTN